MELMESSGTRPAMCGQKQINTSLKINSMLFPTSTFFPFFFLGGGGGRFLPVYYLSNIFKAYLGSLELISTEIII